MQDSGGADAFRIPFPPCLILLVASPAEWIPYAPDLIHYSKAERGFSRYFPHCGTFGKC